GYAAVGEGARVRNTRLLVSGQSSQRPTELRSKQQTERAANGKCHRRESGSENPRDAAAETVSEGRFKPSTPAALNTQKFRVCQEGVGVSSCEVGLQFTPVTPTCRVTSTTRISSNAVSPRGGSHMQAAGIARGRPCP